MRRPASVLLSSVVCATLAACAPKSGPPRVPNAVVAESVPPAKDWDAELFPKAERAPAPLPAPPDAPPAPEAVPVFAPSDFYATEDDVSVAFADVAAFCADALRAAEAPISRDTPVPGRVPRTPTCRRIPVGAAFAPSAGFASLRAVRVMGADFAYSTLLVQLDCGLVPLSVSWDHDDPNDPGCPSIVRRIAIERVSVEHGLLVVVALGATTTWVEVPEGAVGDSGARQQLVRQVTVAKRVRDGLHTRTFAAWSGPALGWKLQPHATRWVPWEKLMWRDFKAVHVLADGTLALPR